MGIQISRRSVLVTFLFTAIMSIAQSQCLTGNCQEGIGVKVYPDSGRFEGQFVNGNPKEGTYYYASGDIYTGAFEGNYRQGFGTYQYKDGQTFRGFFTRDLKDYGVYTFKNGDQYTGTFNNNKPSGFGTKRMKSGDVLEGMWEDGKLIWQANLNESNFNAPPDTSTRWITSDNRSKALTPRMFAVIVGISDYEGSSSDLNYSDDDATIFYNHLNRAFARELSAGKCSLLLNAQATKLSITAAINNVFNMATENDYIIFFFSGHGRQGAFVTHDLNSSGLTHQELKGYFKATPAKYKLCIADACFSGSVGDQNSSTTSYSDVQELRDARLAVLLSSTNQQTSAEMSSLGQGLFCYWLMNGLRGAADLNEDDYVTAGELFVYTRKVVELKSGGEQIPVIIGQNLDRIPLCRLK